MHPTLFCLEIAITALAGHNSIATQMFHMHRKLSGPSTHLQLGKTFARHVGEEPEQTPLG